MESRSDCSYVHRHCSSLALCDELPDLKGLGDCCAGSPLELVQPDTLRWKVMEPVLLLGKQRFEGVDIRIRASGGGHVSQIYGVYLQLFWIC